MVRSGGWLGSALGLTVPRTTCDIWAVLDTAQWQQEPLRGPQTHRQADIQAQTQADSQNSPSSFALQTVWGGGGTWQISFPAPPKFPGVA